LETFELIANTDGEVLVIKEQGDAFFFGGH
jgi:hypothetical protein